MQTKFVHFALNDGYLDHWLAAGPQQFFVEDEALLGGKHAEAIARLYADPNLRIDEAPVERGPVSAGLFQMDDFSGAWNYVACGEDHRVDQSGYIPAWAYLRSWAYNHLYSKVEQSVVLEISACGPFWVWLNGVPVYAQDHFSDGKPTRYDIPLEIRKGGNPLFVRFENVAVGQFAHSFTARLCQPGSQKALRGLRCRTARVDPTRVSDATAYEYLRFDDEWSEHAEDAIDGLRDQTSMSATWNEFTHSYITVAARLLDENMELRRAPNPWGPWDAPVTLFDAATPSSWFVNDARVHPGLQASEREMVLTYHSNTETGSGNHLATFEIGTALQGGAR